jgi:hypothetical protein
MAALRSIELLIAALEPLDLAYMVTGSVASMVYGEPRLTLGVDLAVALELARADDLLRAFPESDFYRPPLEVVRLECARTLRGHFNLIHHLTGMKADVYLAADDELHRWGLANRRRVAFEGMELPLAPPEYVIVRKLEFWREGGSEKHVRDVRAMLDAGLVLDNAFLETEIRARGLQEAWQEVRRAR